MLQSNTPDLAQIVLPDGLELIHHNFTYESLEHEFERINSQGWIDMAAVYSDTKLDVPATGDKVTARIVRVPLLSDDARLAPSPTGWVVRINESLPEDHVPFVFGHELGHIMIYNRLRQPNGFTQHEQRLRQDDRFYQFVEAFCDFFSAKLNKLTWY